MKENNAKYTVSGTNIDEVKRQNANSGLTYNELNELIAKQQKEKENNQKTI
ncbi:MAG: hypothetical protein ABS934_06900 [Psychrobacillus sp.]